MNEHIKKVKEVTAELEEDIKGLALIHNLTLSDMVGILEVIKIELFDYYKNN